MKQNHPLRQATPRGAKITFPQLFGERGKKMRDSQPLQPGPSALSQPRTCPACKDCPSAPPSGRASKDDNNLHISDLVSLLPSLACKMCLPNIECDCSCCRLITLPNPILCLCCCLATAIVVKELGFYGEIIFGCLDRKRRPLFNHCCATVYVGEC